MNCSATASSARRTGERTRRQLASPAMDRSCARRSSAADEKDHARWLIWEIGPGRRRSFRRRSRICTWPAAAARPRIHRSGDQRARHGVRHGALDLPHGDRKKAGAFILEIARSEIAYTDQRPAEYVAVMLAAALREGFRGPVFIQGDHFQVNAKKYAVDPDRSGRREAAGPRGDRGRASTTSTSIRRPSSTSRSRRSTSSRSSTTRSASTF